MSTKGEGQGGFVRECVSRGGQRPVLRGGLYLELL